MSFDDYTPGKAVGLRYNKGKVRLELIPPEWTWGLGEVLTQGALKYADRNWELGLSYSDVIGCGKRHREKYMLGEMYDTETGCHHLLHSAWNDLAIVTFDVRGLGINDLPKYEADVIAMLRQKGEVR